MTFAKPRLFISFPAPTFNIVPYLVPNSAVSSRRLPLVHVSTIRLNSRRLILLQTLCGREKRQLLSNQAKPHSFCKTPGGGYTPKSLTCGIRNLQTLRSRLSCNLVNVTLRESPLCFHGLTNPFSRNLFRFTSIQNPGGVESQKQSLGSDRRTLGETRGEQERTAGYGESYEGAGPLVAIAGTGGDAGRVKQ